MTAAAGDSNKGAEVYRGRLETAKRGFGAYVCYAKRLWGGEEPSADATILKRPAIASAGGSPGVAGATERVPSSGAVPTGAEVAKWVAAKLGVPEAELRPEELSDQVAANDWVDELGVRHVRLVQWDDEYEAPVEASGVIVHLKGQDAVLITGGVVPDLKKRTAEGEAAAALKAVPARSATGAGQQQQQQLITPEAAAAIALKAALSTVPDAPASLAARLRAAAANPSREALVAASAAPATRRVVHCGKSGKCRAAYKQVVSLPATKATGRPQELHVYVAARGGGVLLMRNRLRTAAGPDAADDDGTVRAAAATRPFVPKGLAVAKPLPLPAEEAAKLPSATSGVAPGSKPQQRQQQQPAAPKKPQPAAKPAAPAAKPGPSDPHGPGHEHGDDQPPRRQAWMSLGRGNSLYSGQVPLNTAQGAGGSAGRLGAFMMRDMIHNSETFDLMNKEDGKAGAGGEALFRDKDNVW